MRPALDDPVQRAVARYYRLVSLGYLGSVGVLVVVFGYAVLLASPTTTVALGITGLAVAAAWYGPRFDLRSELRLETSKPPDAVRDDFASLANPLTAFAVGWADEIRDCQPDADAVDVVVDGTFFGIFAHQYRLRVDRTGENIVRIRFGGQDADAGTTELAVQPGDSGTRIDVTSTDDVRLTGLLLAKLQARYQEQVLAHYGYRTTDASTNISLRLR